MMTGSRRTIKRNNNPRKRKKKEGVMKPNMSFSWKRKNIRLKVQGVCCTIFSVKILHDSSSDLQHKMSWP